ncbi:MAG: TetR/AcrR family transcriptional regulator [Ilumatobacteraceae bacterium]
MMVSDDTAASPHRRPPLTARGHDKRQRILDEAADILARQGYAGTTLADIAKAAGTHAGSLFYHFGSREELAEEVFTAGARAALHHVSTAVAALPDGVSARIALETAIVAHVAFILERSPAALASIRSIGQIPAAIAEPLQVVFAEYGHYFADLIKAAVEEGSLDSSVDASVVRMLLLGAANWTAEWYHPHGPAAATEIGQQLCRMVFDGFGSGRRRTRRTPSTP